MNKSKLYIIILAIVAVAAMIFIYQSIPDTNDLEVSEYIDDQYINTDLGEEDINIKASYSNKIVYGSSDDFNIEALRGDCEDRGGTFNECGSPCGPEADACIEVCAYTCEFEEQTSVEEEELSQIDWENYYNEEFRVGFSYLPTMNIESNQDGSISFVHLGPTQELGTEVYDGIIFSVNRIDNTEDLSLSEYAQMRLDNNEIATVAEEVSEYESNNLSGYSYSLISAGSETTYIFLRHENNSILELRYSVSDPGDYGYQEMVDYMLNSIVI
jgi:hypothetical protein